jgi:hypothetical protein
MHRIWRRKKEEEAEYLEKEDSEKKDSEEEDSEKDGLGRF